MRNSIAGKLFYPLLFNQFLGNICVSIPGTDNFEIPIMQVILGIETSCDETAAAIVADGHRILGSAVSSQIAKHSCYGGVVPELAAREHLDSLLPVVATAMKEAKMAASDLSAVAVTNGPGLMPALLVGVNFAKGLSSAHKVPIIGVNHFLAHIYGSFLDEEPPLLADPSLYPMLALVVSGGHTALVLISSNGEARVIGHTLDDAAGEAFDKAAKLLNLGYPGGPVIEKAATKGNPACFQFPRSLTGSTGHAHDDANRFNFSFSGLKTALLYHCRKLGGPETLDGAPLFDTIASYQEAIVDVLCQKTFFAARHYSAKSLVLCGGVACNNPLRQRFAETAPRGIRPFVAPKKYCTD
ncbi:MAG: tRNA (adenosine(37)-N6)-threonylcarbamoyltransferase complex transferase subunit TsaD, partial [Lentisphaerae bacterium GWF2_52_8]